MSNAVARRQNGSPAVETNAPKNPLAEKLGMDSNKLEFYRRELGNGAPDNALEHFLRFCQVKGLDPSAKEVYFIPRTTDGVKKWTIQTGIDGYRALAESTGEYEGQDEPVFKYDAAGKLESATVTVYRSGKSRGFPGTARWNEYVQTKDGRPTQMWGKMPHNQLAKCAEALALRKAFPRKLGGIYTNEEMAQASSMRTVTPAQMPAGSTQAQVVRAQLAAAAKIAAEPEAAAPAASESGDADYEVASEIADVLRDKSTDEIRDIINDEASQANLSHEEMRTLAESLPGGKVTRNTAPLMIELVRARRPSDLIDEEVEIGVAGEQESLL